MPRRCRGRSSTSTDSGMSSSTTRSPRAKARASTATRPVRSRATDLVEKRRDRVDCCIGASSRCRTGAPWWTTPTCAAPDPDLGQPARRTLPGHHSCRCSTTARAPLAECRSGVVAVVLDGDEVLTRLEVDLARPHGAVRAAASRVGWPRQHHDAMSSGVSPATSSDGWWSCGSSAPVGGRHCSVLLAVEQAEAERTRRARRRRRAGSPREASRRSHSARSRSDQRSARPSMHNHTADADGLR